MLINWVHHPIGRVFFPCQVRVSRFQSATAGPKLFFRQLRMLATPGREHMPKRMPNIMPDVRIDTRKFGMLPACSEPWHGLLPLLAHQTGSVQGSCKRPRPLKSKPPSRSSLAFAAFAPWNIMKYPPWYPMMFPSFPNEIPIRSMGNPPNAARCPVSVLPFPFPDQSMALTPSQIRARTVRALWRATWALAHGSGSRGQKFLQV